MELDVWLPKLKICFEFQVRGEVSRRKEKDGEGRGIERKAGELRGEARGANLCY